jgi:hypothetical protein
MSREPRLEDEMEHVLPGENTEDADTAPNPGSH